MTEFCITTPTIKHGFRHLSSRLISGATLLALFSFDATAAVTNFTGEFANSNWTSSVQVFGCGSSSVVANSTTVTLSTANGCASIGANYTHTNSSSGAVRTGTASFSYSVTQSQPHTYTANYGVVGGAFTTLTNSTPASGSASLAVSVGQQIQFGVSKSSGFGITTLVISGFSFNYAPAAPTGVDASAGNGQASISWSAPGDVGDSAITGYTVTASPGGATCMSSTASCVVSGLSNGTAYTFTVTATNVYGTGPSSLASSAVTPSANATPVLGAIGNQTGSVARPVRLQVSAADADAGDTLTFAATGLPTGLSINPSTGEITGIPTTPQAYTTTITVSDGITTDSETFTWTIKEALNPLEDPEVVALLEAVGQFAPRVAQQTLNPVKGRMATFLSAPRDRLNNLSSQGIKLAMNDANPGMSTLLDHSGLMSGLNSSGDLFNNGWAIWTAGNVIVGKSKSSDQYLINDITFGADKRITTALTAGMALRAGWEDNDAGTGSSFDADTYSATAYGSYVLSDKTFLQTAVGYSSIDISTKRTDGTDLLKGSRDAHQVIYSLTLSHQIEHNGMTLWPYGSLDGSYTRLEKYTETGSANALTYHAQAVRALALTLGVRGSYFIKQPNGALVPRFNINYQGDLDSDTDVTVNYATIPSTTFTRTFDADASSSWLLGLGVDVHRQNLIFSVDYERSQQMNWGHSDTLRFMLNAAF